MEAVKNLISVVDTPVEVVEEVENGLKFNIYFAEKKPEYEEEKSTRLYYFNIGNPAGSFNLKLRGNGAIINNLKCGCLDHEDIAVIVESYLYNSWSGWSLEGSQVVEYNQEFYFIEVEAESLRKYLDFIMSDESTSSSELLAMAAQVQELTLYYDVGITDNYDHIAEYPSEYILKLIGNSCVAPSDEYFTISETQELIGFSESEAVEEAIAVLEEVAAEDLQEYIEELSEINFKIMEFLQC